MSLPVGLTTATITGTYIDVTGTAQAGSVSFTPTSTVYDAAGKAVLTETAVTAVLSAGVFTLGPIPCTDNAGLTPNGWAYTVSINVAGAQTTFTAYLPHALGTPVDITQLPENPVTLSPSGVSYLPNAATVPTTNPSGGGGFLYAENGALFWLGIGGNATQIGPAQGGLTNPMTTAGDMITATAGGTPARLAGNATSTKEFLTSTGSGGVATTPAWAVIAAGDLPSATGTTAGVVQLAGDLAGTAASPQVTGTHLASALPIAQGGTGQATASTALAALGGAAVAGDIGGTSASPQITGTHLAAPLPIVQGGTGQNSQQTALDALAGGVTSGQYLRGNGTHVALSTLQLADIPAGVALLAGATFSGYIAPAVVTLSFGASIAVNAALGNVFAVTLTASTGTLANPTNPVDGQAIRVRVIQDATGSRTLAYGTAYDFGAAGAPTLSTGASKVDVLGFEYVASLTKWCYLGSGLGF